MSRAKTHAQAWRLEPPLPGTFYTDDAHFAGERIIFRERLCVHLLELLI